jgi:hypothetical protein
MGEALMHADALNAERPRQPGSSGRKIHLLDNLIDRVRACERVFDLAGIARNGTDTEDIVFIDDLSDVLAINKTINEQSADSASLALAARYSTMLKAALHVLLQIRQLHSDVGAHRPERLTRRN